MVVWGITTESESDWPLSSRIGAASYSRLIRFSRMDLIMERKRTVFFLNGLRLSSLAFARRSFAALRSNVGEGGKFGLVESTASSSISSTISGVRFFLDFWTSSHALFMPDASELERLSQLVKLGNNSILIPSLADTDSLLDLAFPLCDFISQLGLPLFLPLDTMVSPNICIFS